MSEDDGDQTNMNPNTLITSEELKNSAVSENYVVVETSVDPNTPTTWEEPESSMEDVTEIGRNYI